MADQTLYTINRAAWNNRRDMLCSSWRTANGTIPAHRLVKGHTDGTLIVGTLQSKRIIGVNTNADGSSSGDKFHLGWGPQTIVAAEPLLAGDLLKCGDNGRVLQMVDADNLDVVIDDSAGTEFGNQPANDGVEIISDNAGDTTQTITIIGTTNGVDTVVVETKTLTGTSQVATTKTDWGLILAVKLSASCAGTVTVREASGNATIVTLTTGQTSKGVVTVPAADQGAHGLIPYIKAGGASTKQVGMQYETTAGATAYDSNALNGTSAVPMNAAANRVMELYVGDVAAATTATMYTVGTEEDENVCVGKALETIATGAEGLAFIW